MNGQRRPIGPVLPPYAVPLLGPLDRLPEMTSDLVISLAWQRRLQPITVRPDANDVGDCPVCGAIAIANYEKFDEHLRNGWSCMRKQAAYWSHAHGWSMLHGDKAIRATVSAPNVKRQVGKWVDAIKREGGVVSSFHRNLTDGVDASAPSWIVDAIRLYEESPGLHTMGRSRYLRAVIKPVRKALGLEKTG